MTPVVVVPPSFEPVTPAECRAELRLGDDESRDPEIVAAIAAARSHVESYLGIALAERTLEVTGYTSAGGMPLIVGPVGEVLAVSAGGVDLPPGSWLFGSNAFGSFVTVGGVWEGAGPYTVAYVAGYADAADIPEAIRHAIRVVVRRLFDGVDGDPLAGVPYAMLSPFRVIP